MNYRCTDVFSTQSVISNERGVVFPLMAFAIIAIFAMMGLAIDGGRMYSASLASQNWADAAAFSAASQIVLHSNDYDNLSTTVMDDARSAARQIVVQSARFSSFETRNMGVNVSVDTSGGTIRTKSVVQFAIPLFLMRVVPGFGTEMVLRNEAQAEVTPALGMIAMDASGSMNCPHSGDCSACYPNCGPDSNRRLGELLEVVKKEFLGRFDKARDMIGILIYDKTVKTLVPIKPSGGFDSLSPLAEEAYVNNAKTFQPSNPTLALIRAYETVNGYYVNPLFRNRTPFIGLLTDGAPSASCFHLSDINPGVSGDFIPPPPPPPAPASPPRHIGCTWEITFEGFFDLSDPTNFIVPGDSSSGVVPGRKLQKEGIAPLSIAVSYNSIPDDLLDIEKGYQQPECSKLTFQGWAGPELAGDPEDGINELGSCLNSLRTRDLDGNIFPQTLVEASINRPEPTAGGALSGIDQWRKHFYHTAVAQADAIRGRGFAIYTFGLGLHTPPSIPDPYDSLDDTLGMKRSMLERIALQYNQPAYVSTLQGQNPPKDDYPIPHTWQSLRGNDRHQKGEFFPVDYATADIMEQRMKEFVRRIKVRMVN
jgi:hypothetical protein